jgi:hypothetical protein
LSPSHSAASGSRVQGAAPNGTVSRWPVKQRGSFPPLPFSVATTLLRPSLRSWIETAKAASSRIPASNRAQADSSPGGLTDRNRTRSRVSSIAETTAILFP